jgi:magnesium-transporting ATPase (P-type)
MIYLNTNTANQQVYLSLDEARQYYSTAFTHYLIILTHEENSTTGNDLAQVATIVNETVRVTQLTISTVGLTLAGRYRYVVYGQNSSSNTNPTNAAVVGIVERGYAVLNDNTSWFDVPINTIPNDIIYEP